VLYYVIIHYDPSYLTDAKQLFHWNKIDSCTKHTKVSWNQCLPTFFVKGINISLKQNQDILLEFYCTLYKLPSQQNCLCSSNMNTEAFHQRRAQSEVVPEHTMKAYIGNRGLALVILNPGARWRWVLKVMPQPFCPPPPSPLHQARELWYPLNRRLGGPRVDIADSKSKISCTY